jgi:hypothetical protein
MKPTLRVCGLLLFLALPVSTFADGFSVSVGNGGQQQAGPWYLYWPIDAQMKSPGACAPQFLPPQFGAYQPQFNPVPVGPMPAPAYPGTQPMGPGSPQGYWPQQPATRPVGYWPAQYSPWFYGNR